MRKTTTTTTTSNSSNNNNINQIKQQQLLLYCTIYFRRRRAGSKDSVEQDIHIDETFSSQPVQDDTIYQNVAITPNVMITESPEKPQEKGEPLDQESERRMTASVRRNIHTHKRLQRTLFIRTRQNKLIFGVIPFVKLQNDT